MERSSRTRGLIATAERAAIEGLHVDELGRAVHADDADVRGVEQRAHPVEAGRRDELTELRRGVDRAAQRSIRQVHARGARGEEVARGQQAGVTGADHRRRSSLVAPERARRDVEADARDREGALTDGRLLARALSDAESLGEER